MLKLDEFLCRKINFVAKNTARRNFYYSKYMKNYKRASFVRSLLRAVAQPTLDFSAGTM